MSSRKRGRQEVLGKPTEENLFVEPEIVRPRSSKKEGRRWGARKGGTSYSTLRQEISQVYGTAMAKGRIFADPSMYFVVTFSDNFRSPIIRNIIQKMGLDVLEAIGDNIAKVRISKSEYETFLKNLEKNSVYVENIRESTLKEKIEEPLLRKITEEPEKRVRVNIEVSRLKDSRAAERVVEKLHEYIRANELGKIETAYRSERFLLLTGELAGKTVQEIAQDLDAITRINLARAVRLRSGRLSSTSLDEGRVARLRVRSLARTPREVPAQEISAMPSICILDSGINSAHELLKPFVADTYDIAARSQTPCDDNLGHGSMVAGIAIYGGEVPTGEPSARIVAVKLFENGSFDGNIIGPISETVRKFKGKTRIFNLSFSSEGPDPILSRALDDLSFKEKVLFVVCAGNIDSDQIIEELQGQNGYPTYLTRYPIFFPGDCFNVLTVGSFAEKDSNFVPKQRPSPFTRTYPFRSRTKPEVLASGGNVNLEREEGIIVGLNPDGCGIVSTSKDDNRFEEDVGTSFACPVVSSIAAGLAEKFPSRSTSLYKALIASSCERLIDGTGRQFDASVQGFGTPSKRYAMFSTFWRVNLCADSSFDLKDRRQLHRYKFLFPDVADRIIITLCFDVEPLQGSELPYEIQMRLHKPGTLLSASITPNNSISADDSNIRQFEYKVERGGKGVWTLDVSPRTRRSFWVDPSAELLLRYAIVISIISDEQQDIYARVRKFSQSVK